MLNVGCSLIGLHDPDTHTIQFSGAFIGRQNVAFAATNPNVRQWSVGMKGYYEGGPSAGVEIASSDNGATVYYTDTSVTPNVTKLLLSMDATGKLTYSKDNMDTFKCPGSGTAVTKINYSMIRVNCRAYSPDNDAYEELTFFFRYGQIAT